MYIRVNPHDNVAIVVDPEGAAKGSPLPGDLVVREAIPQAHKVALADLAAGKPVIRYGHTIGYANRAIPAGSWIREDLLDMPPAPALDALPLATAPPPALPPLTGYTFDGYRNPHISLHANLAADPLVVSLGCEKLQPARLFGNELPVLGEPNLIRLQDEGFEETVSAILSAAERRLQRLDARRRVPCPASDLVVGLQCGGSDAFSGVTCNPAVGFAADLLVRAGATVLFSEVTEVRDAIHLLTPRAATPEVARVLIREMAWYDEYLARGYADRSANTTPGNKRGGLANIVEKALGSVAKAGSSAIMAVASHGEKVTAKGLVFAATPASDFICGTQQLASMNFHIFTTGEGSPYGLSLVPVMKVSSRTALAEKWRDLIDLDAGRIATGKASIEEVGWEIFRAVLEVAGGRRKTWAEHWGLGNALSPFNPGPVT
jgi:galactarate dehydratase